MYIRFTRLIEHTIMIWDEIQVVKKEKLDLTVIWFGLPIVFGSVPHSLLEYNRQREMGWTLGNDS